MVFQRHKQTYMRVCLILLAQCFISCSHATIVEHSISSPIDSAIHDLCNRDIAILGEASHGSGLTFQLKTQLVKRLVNECHYNAFFIESGIYDFLMLEQKLKQNQQIASEDISRALGGIWDVEEVKSLVSFLDEAFQAGKIQLGGLDDQIGRGTLAVKNLAAQLTKYLPLKNRNQCFETIQKYMIWKYTETDPYDVNANLKIQKCLGHISKSIELSPIHNQISQNELYKVTNLKRFFQRDLELIRGGSQISTELANWDFNDRDQSMFENFKWLRKRMKRTPKIIIWTHNIHAAKDLTKTTGETEPRHSLGSHIAKDFKERSFSLAFSAYSGSEGMKGFPIHNLEPAPLDSLEGRAFVKSESKETRYLNSQTLQKAGEALARPLNYIWQKAQWNNLFDGLIILREEHPPH
jgi:erythromycin esterase-like protein